MKKKRTKRAKILGTSKRPRLSVFRSNKGMYAQMINDEKGTSLVAASVKDLSKKQVKGKTGIEIATLVGEELAKKARKKRITKVIFDRRAYKYHGQVKALAESARKGGLKF